MIHMNYIFMSESLISAFTDSVEAEEHKHWMLQLFMSLEGDLDIKIKGKSVHSSCVIVNKNVNHCFFTHNSVHFTMLIDAASDISAMFKDKYLAGADYYIFDSDKINFLQIKLQNLIKDLNEESYKAFISLFFDILGIKASNIIKYDSRIIKLLDMLEKYDLTDYSLKDISEKVLLSESRLSHIFKEETGIPLKSYIVLCKLQKAYMYLLQGKSITYAAVEAGFDSPSHFAYTSKSLTGMSASYINKDSVFLKVSNLEKK